MTDQKSQYGTAPPSIQARNRSPSALPVPKVQAAVGGAALGPALVTFCAMLLERREVIMSPVEVGVWAILAAALFAFLGGYFVKPQGGILGGDEPRST